jgi:putative component of membrane protein insertase Oxa1/YidC/SpoIIIJ protein YidD
LTSRAERIRLDAAVRRQHFLARLALRAIGDYQASTAAGPRVCAYDESCSNYAARQIRERGLVRGGVAAFRRYRTCTVDTAR